MTGETTNLRATRLAGLFAPAVVDVFAGCGGWSIGAEQAFVEGGYTDRYIDLMINHWNVAVGVHQMNHPLTQHLQANVLEVDPNAVLTGRRLVYAHFSPDCTDHSKAKGGKPKRKEIRALADVVIVWAAKRRPLVITLENVEEFQQWGPLLKNGMPDKRKRGQEFLRWKGELEALGYVFEHDELRACNFGDPTTRKRLLVIARCDGKPIVWPKQTHAAPDQIAEAKRRIRRERFGLDRDELAELRNLAGCKPYRTAAECIDWDTPMLSIFATRPEARAWSRSMNVGRDGKVKDRHERMGCPQRPLKLNTQRRLAGGLFKWVLDQAEPFIVNIQNSKWGPDNFPVSRPLPTVTANPKGGAFAAADVELATFTSTLNHGGKETRSADLRQPINTITAARDARALVNVEMRPAFARIDGGNEVGIGLPSPVRDASGSPTRMPADSDGAPGIQGPQNPVTTVRHPTDAPCSTSRDVEERGMAGRISSFTAGVGGRAGQSAPTSVDSPLPTVTGKADRVIGAVALNKHNTGVIGQAADAPIGTITGIDHHSILAAHLVKFRGDSVGTPMTDPVPTVTSGAGAARDAGAAHAMGMSCAYLSHAYSSNKSGGMGGDPAEPLNSITAGSTHANVAVVYLTPYYGNDKEGAAVNRPMPTVVSHDRFGLAAVDTLPGSADGEPVERHWVLSMPGLRRAQRVARWARKMLGKKVEKFLLPVRDEAGKLFHLLTVTVKGALHLITDILMRMLKPRELARAQGFDDSYVIDRMIDNDPQSKTFGREIRLGKADQVKLIGNSVPPAFSRAIVRDNVVLPGLLDDEPDGADVLELEEVAA